MKPLNPKLSWNADFERWSSPLIDKIGDLCETADITIVSYGLAPNPNGFCFERSDDTSDRDCQRLSQLLDQLSSTEVEALRVLCFGGVA